MAFRQIKSPALGTASVTTAKLDPTAVSGQTVAGSVSSLDSFVVHAAGSSALVNVTAAALIGSYDTDDLAEGSTNIWYTDARALAANTAAISTAVAAEETRALAAEGVLTAAVAAEITATNTDVSTLTTNLATEITDRAAAVAAEAVTARAAESANATAISNILSNVDAVALNSLAEIVTEFQTSDNALTASIATNASGLAAEITAARAAEATLTTNLAAEATTARAAEAVNAAAVVTEATARAAADTALDTRVTAAEGTIIVNTNGLAAEITATNADVSTLTTNLAAEATTARGAEAANATAITAETTRAGNAEVVNANAITAEASTARAAEVANAALVAAEAVTARAAEAANTAAISSNDTDITNLQSELDASQTGAGLSSAGAYVAPTTSNYHDSATSLANADMKLDAQIKINADAVAAEITATNADVTSLTADIATNASSISNIISNVDAAALDSLTEIVAAFQTADSTLTGNVASNLAAIQAEAVTARAAEGANATAIASEIVNRGAADTALDTSLTAAFVAADIVVTNAASADATSKANAAQAAAIADSDAANVAHMGDASLNGSVGHTVTDRIATAKAAAITAAAADTDADVAVEVTARTNADSALQLQITSNDGELSTHNTNIAANTAAITSEASTARAAESANATAITSEATTARAAELVLTNGLAAEAVTARAAEVANATAISNETTARTNADTTHTANIATNAGLIASNTAVGTANAASIASILTNTDPAALDSLTEIVADFQSADVTLQAIDTAATTDRALIRTQFATADASIQTELDATQVGAGLNANGSWTAHSGTNHIDGAGSMKAVGPLLDTQVKVNADAIAAEAVTARAAEVANAALVTAEAATARAAEGVNAAAIASNDTDLTNHQTEIDAVETAVGLAGNGTFAQHSGTNYIDGGTTMKGVDALLDAAAKANADAITAEASTARAAEVSNANAITSEATTARAAESANAAAAAANLVEITTSQAGAGLSAAGAYVAPTTSNYHDTASTLANADMKIDAALKAVDTAYLAADATLTTNLAAEATTARAAEVANAAAVVTEAAARAAADTALDARVTTNTTSIAFIESNVDAAALDSLTEIVAAFEAADSTLTGAVAANTSQVATNVTAIATNATAVTTEATARAAADSAQDVVIATKLALAGGTMAGAIAMGSNQITGLANPALAGDAVNKGWLDTQLANTDISNNDTDDLSEGSTNLYFTNARARAAISLVDTAGNGLAAYNSTTGVLTINTDESVLDLTDVSDTNYTGKAEFLLQVNAGETGMSLVDPLDVFTSNWRQTINGDGSAVTFALTQSTDQANSMVFVGGVIQDPTTHYTINGVANTITFNSAMPVGTSAVVIAHQSGLTPVLTTGQVTTDKLASNIKAYVQGSDVAAATGGSVIDTFAKATYRTAKYIMQIECAGEFETREALVVHNGTTAYITEFAIVYTGAALLGDADVAVNGGNIEVSYTAASSNTTVKVISTYIDV